jgi:hypothetical protein
MGIFVAIVNATLRDDSVPQGLMRSTNLNMLMVKVKSQAIRANSKTATNDFDLLQADFWRPCGRASQLPSTPAIDSKASARLADSKIMKARSRRTSRSFAAGGLSPRGLEKYSSCVIMRM